MNALAWLRAIVEWEAARRDQPGSVAGAQAVALQHVLYADEIGQCRASGREIARATGVHRDTVQDLRGRWLEHGWLVDVSCRGRSVVYRLAKDGH